MSRHVRQRPILHQRRARDKSINLGLLDAYDSFALCLHLRHEVEACDRDRVFCVMEQLERLCRRVRHKCLL